MAAVTPIRAMVLFLILGMRVALLRVVELKITAEMLASIKPMKLPILLPVHLARVELTMR